MQIDQKQFKTRIDATSKFRSLKTATSPRKLSFFIYPTPLDTLIFREIMEQGKE